MFIENTLTHIVTRNFDGANIPSDPNNRDYIEYLTWLADGNMPEKHQAPKIELSISPSQQIILANGEDVAIVTINGDPDSTVEYTVNGELQILKINESGLEHLELTCDTPNTTLLVQAGTAKAVVYAVEVPV